MAPLVSALYIINKYGGLIYNQDFSSSKLSNNDHLMLASTFHGLHTIATQMSPMGPSGGIEVLHTDTFRLECYETPTGLKFYVVAERGQANLLQTLKAVYGLYGDYVLKNPFYDLDQPIRCELFDLHVTGLLNPSRASNR